MKLEIFSIYDKKSNTYNNPMFAQTSGVIVREFISTLSQEDKAGHWAKYPEDFTLIKIGTFDNETGEITKLEKNELVAEFTTIKSMIKE